MYGNQRLCWVDGMNHFKQTARDYKILTQADLAANQATGQFNNAGAY
jgi:hypothetical protein